MLSHCFLPLSLLLLSVVGATLADDAPSPPPIHCQNGAVVCVSPPAAEVGLQALKRGGNAVDAAVATAFALAVTYPSAGNLGGGGFLLAAPTGGEPLCFDFRETAPAAASADMFVDPAQRTTHRRVGVPGTVRGLALAHRRLGALPWRDLVYPAIALARDGFVLDAADAKTLNAVLARSDKRQFAELHKALASPGGEPWQAGQRLVQPELARTLERIAEEGPDAFYLGEIADQIVAEMQRGGGLITHADLAFYRPRVRTPVVGEYRGFEVIGAPPPSSGGTVLVQALNILESFELDADRWSPRNIHLTVEAMKRAYCDRARYLADPDHAEIPAKLLSKEYARQLAAGIDPQQATPSADLAADIPLASEGSHTTHLSVVDRQRNAVSLTYTLESSYGSRVVVAGAGFLLNDEMNDFNWLPGVTDASGRIGTEPNLAAPGKRMLSSMSPTIVRRDSRPVLITGSPGGRTIINTVLCVTTNVLDFGMDVRAAVDAPRLHHQWLPDELRVEPALAAAHPETIERLRAMGHKVVESRAQGDAHSIALDPPGGAIRAAADARINGHVAGY